MTPFEFLRMVSPATSAQPGVIAKLTSESPKLAPNEVRLIRKLFGDEVANVASERSDLSLEPKMTEAQEQRLIESIRANEAKAGNRLKREAQTALADLNRAEVRAQETKDTKDINAANREAQKLIDAQARAEKEEFESIERYLREIDRANERANAAAARAEQRANIQGARAQEARDLTDQRNEAAATADEARANMRALEGMGKPYRDAAREEWDSNMRALAAEWKSSYDGIFRRAEEAAGNLGGPNAGAIIRYQLQGNRAILDRLTSPEGLGALALHARAAVTGDLADSYLTALQRRTETLRSAFAADGMGPDVAKKVAYTFRDAELRKRYGSTTMPKQVADMLAELKSPEFRRVVGRPRQIHPALEEHGLLDRLRGCGHATQGEHRPRRRFRPGWLRQPHPDVLEPASRRPL